MSEVFITDAVRTAIGSFGGTLADMPPAELGKVPVAAVLKRNSLAADAADEVIMGSVLQAGWGQNVARQVALAAGIDKAKTALTVNMVCGSGLRAVGLAAQSIKCGNAGLVIAGGVESMNGAAYLLRKARTGYRMGNGELVDSMVFDGLTDIFNNYHMGITAENVAAKYGITREAQDEFAALSQQKTEKAQAAGKFRDEIIPVILPQKKGDPIVFDKDEFPRPGVTAEKLSKLRPAFKKDGTVTAGNASGINDGAAALLVAGAEAVKKYNLKPMARIASCAYAGVDPSVMGVGPVDAVKKALSKAGWSLSDVGLIEANEAFAAQSLAVAKELGLNPEITNVNGGAIALGHPIGASGARILVTLLHEMRRRSVKKGLATLCIGGGMGIAMCVELA